jgi:hypothetical protein
MVYSDEEQQFPTSQFVDLGSIQPIYDSYESDSKLDMQDFQEHTAKSHPLFFEEKYYEEINHPRPVEDAEQQIKEQIFPTGLVYDDYEFDPWERHEEEKEQHEYFISCPEPVSEKPSSEVSQPASFLIHLCLPEIFNHV